MTTWINEDGLVVKFGTTEADPVRVTEYSSDGPNRLVEIVVDADYLPASDTVVLDGYVFPEGAELVSYQVQPDSEAFADGTDVDVALVDASDQSSNSVAVATLTLANLNGMDSGDLDSVAALAAPKIITLTTDGEFSAGKTSVLIEYTIPKEETDTLVWNKSA